jgi:hypothetical protein
VLLICEACHRRWTLPSGKARRATCPRCHRQRKSDAGTRRERLHRIAREARTEAEPGGATWTAEGLQKLMDEAEFKATRALDLARTIAARFRPDGT